MSKSRLFILQCLAMVLLLCGYLLRDRPDKLSMMHFDSTSPSVIKKNHRSTNNIDRHHVHVVCSPHHTDKQKTNQLKHFPFEPMTPVAGIVLTAPLETVITHDTPLHPEYKYLFYEEINPPPPKC